MRRGFHGKGLEMRIKLTGLQHNNISAVDDLLTEHSMLQLREEVNAKASNGLAYVFEWGGKQIAYLPELETLRGYYKDAYSLSHRVEVALWGIGVADIRDYIHTDRHNLARIWMVKVCEVKRVNGKITEVYINWERENGGIK